MGEKLIGPKRTRLCLGALCKPFKGMAGTTGLEPAASAVTGQRSNQLNYVPTRQINEMRNRQAGLRILHRSPLLPEGALVPAVSPTNHHKFRRAIITQNDLRR